MKFNNILMGCAAAVLAVSSTSAFAAIAVGPGNGSATLNDIDTQLQVFDLTNTATLVAGTYTIDSLNAQFTTSGSGTLTPFLVADVAGVFTPLAIGTSYTSFVAGSFQSYAFGAAKTFTLSQTTTVVAALEWTRGNTFMPIGYNNGSGSIFTFYGGVNSPVIGTALTAVASAGSFPRAYDFSFTLAPSVPEPATWAMMLLGMGAIGFAARGRQHVSVSYA